jgi:hypothetical protein
MVSFLSLTKGVQLQESDKIMGQAKNKSKAVNPATGVAAVDGQTLGRRHILFGWWSLLFYLTLGVFLEMLHGFKIGWYLNVSNESRRLMFTLAHAHGTLLALVQIAAGLTIRPVPVVSAAWRRFGSPALIGASVLLPGGFLLGGLNVMGGDPGYGIFLVPPGALLLFVGVFLTGREALGLRRSDAGQAPDE